MTIRISVRYRKELSKYGIPKTNEIRKIFLPLLNFKAGRYWEMYKFKRRKIDGPPDTPDELIFPTYTINYKGSQRWAVVTEPPLTIGLSDDELKQLIDNPVKCIDYPCHTQHVEHGVATTSQCVKRRRKQGTQVVAVLQTVAARAQNSGQVTHKTFSTQE